MDYKKRNHWTEEEDDTIRQYASTHEAKELANLLPRHPLTSIYVRSYKLGIRLKKSTTPIIPLNGAIWTDEENDLLKQHASNETPIDEIVTILGKSKGAIKHRAKRMNLAVFLPKLPKRKRQAKRLLNNRWTDEENAILKQVPESETSIDELVQRLRRTKRAIRQQAYRLGISLRIKHQVPYWKRRKKPVSRVATQARKPLPAPQQPIPASESETYKQAKLPPRSLLVQLRQEGMTFQEIGELYGMSIDAVYLAFRRGKSEQARFEHGQNGA